MVTCKFNATSMKKLVQKLIPSVLEECFNIHNTVDIPAVRMVGKSKQIPFQEMKAKE